MHAKASDWQQIGSTLNHSIERLLGTLYVPGMSLDDLAGSTNIHLGSDMGLILINMQAQDSWQAQDESLQTTLSSGDLLFIPPGLCRKIQLTPNPSNSALQPGEDSVATAGKLICCQLQFDQLSRESCSLSCQALIQRNYLSESEMEPCKYLVEAIRSHFGGTLAGWEKLVQRLVEAIVVHLVALQLQSNTERFRRVVLSSSATKIESRPSPTMDRVIGPVVIELLNRPERPWSVPQMAQRARVSKSTFTERFHNLVGKSPLQYLTAVRMQRAQKVVGGERYGCRQHCIAGRLRNSFVIQ
ncbi:MAG: AraC family transcriptional regulator [Pirellulales bacterium]